MRGAQRKSGFTLVELLVVVTIMLLLAAAAAPVALTLMNGRSLREASSTTQAVLAGARDRAAASRAVRGVRLIPDAENPSLVRELRYIRPSAPLMTGSAIVVDGTWQAPWDDFTVPFPPSATTPPQLAGGPPGYATGSSWIAASAPPANPQFSLVVLMGCTDASKLRSLPYRLADPADKTSRVYFGVIRLATSGKLLGFTTGEDLIKYVGPDGINYPLLRLDQPVTRPYPYDFQRPGQLPYRAGYNAPAGMQATDYLSTVGDNYTIPIGNIELEGETPILLPNGIVIDLGFIDKGNLAASPPVAPAPPDPSIVRLSRLQPEYTNWDVMFGPTGAVIGSAAGDAHIFLWLREESAPVVDLPVAAAVAPSGTLRMIPTNNSGNHSIVAVITRTGLVRSVEPNFGTIKDMRVPATPPAPLNVQNPTMDSDGTTEGVGLPYWNRKYLYDLFYSDINAPDGGETGL